MSGFDTFRDVSPLTAWNILAKKQRVADGAKIILDVAKESADWFPPLKSALGGVNALVRHYEVSVADSCATVVHILIWRSQEFKGVKEKIEALKDRKSVV